MEQSKSIVIGWDLGGGTEGCDKGAVTIIHVWKDKSGAHSNTIFAEVGTSGAVSLREIMERAYGKTNGKDGADNGAITLPQVRETH